MNLSWLIFYGHQLHMSRQEIMLTRYGELMDMIACLSIYSGNAKQKKTARKRNWSIDEALALR